MTKFEYFKDRENFSKCLGGVLKRYYFEGEDKKQLSRGFKRLIKAKKCWLEWKKE
ncbi:MAG: hypothetical protein GY858_09925 [Candidatus Omnitrophica bacterium]|nr:hypothetical protein [Candidatus Omnitrophota bacterium]